MEYTVLCIWSEKKDWYIQCRFDSLRARKSAGERETILAILALGLTRLTFNITGEGVIEEWVLGSNTPRLALTTRYWAEI